MLQPKYTEIIKANTMAAAAVTVWVDETSLAMVLVM